MPATHSNSTRKSRKGQPLFYRPALEFLENRIAPAAGFYQTLQSAFDIQLVNVRNQAVASAAQSQAALPIVGTSLAHVNIASALDTIAATIDGALSQFDPTWTKDRIRSTLLNTGFIRDVVIPDSGFDPAAGNFAITHLTLVDPSLGSYAFNLGLPGVPFSLSSNIAASLTVNFGDVSFGTRNSQWFMEGPADATVEVALNVDANPTGNGTLGFFQISAGPLDKKSNPPPSAVHLEAGLLFAANVQNNTIAPDNPQLTGGAQVDLHLDAAVKTNSKGVSFPHVATDFHMDWNLGGDYAATDAGLGSAPTVQFEHVQFGLGSYLSSIVQPIARVVKQVTDPLGPMYKIISTPIPGLSDISKAIGQGPVTLLDLAKLVADSGQLPPGYQLLAELGVSLDTLIAKIRDTNLDTANDLMIDAGDFDLNGNGDLRTKLLHGDARTLQQWFQNNNLDDPKPSSLTDLQPYAAAAQSIEDVVEKDTSNDVLHQAAKQIIQYIDGFTKQQNGTQVTYSVRFPVVEAPMQVFNLLLGQDVSLIRFDADFTARAQQDKPVIPDFGLLSVFLDGHININLRFHAGFDTYGLREFIKSVLDNKADAQRLADGFYVETGRGPLVDIDGGIAAHATVQVEYGVGGVAGVFAKADLSGGVDGHVLVSFVDPNSDHKLRLEDERKHVDPLFKVDGAFSVGAHFNVSVGARFLIFKGTVTLVDLNIGQHTWFSGSMVSTRNPVNPTAPAARSIDAIFDANAHAGANDGNADTIVARIRGGTLELLYNGTIADSYDANTVKSLTIVGSGDDDDITVDGSVNVPVKVDGGGGRNSLDFDDSAFAAILPPVSFPDGSGGRVDVQRVNGNPTYTIDGAKVIRTNRYALHVTHVLADGRRFTALDGRSSSEAISYANVDSFAVRGSDSMKDTFQLNGDSVMTSLGGGSNDDIFRIGNSHNLDRLLDNLFIQGAGGSDTLILDDTNIGANRHATYNIGPVGGIGYQNVHRSTYLSWFSQDLNNGAGGYVTYEDSQQDMEFDGIDRLQLSGSGAGNNFVVDTVGEDSNDPFAIDLNTGTGDDKVQISSTTFDVNIEGQNGFDSVTVGAAGFGTDDVLGSVNISNTRGHTYVHLDDTGSTAQRHIALTASDINGFNGGIHTIHFVTNDVAGIDIRGGNGDNEFDVNDTPSITLAGTLFGVPVFITTGNGSNTIHINRAQGPVTIDSQSKLNRIFIGGSPSGNLGKIKGAVTIRGVADELDLNDSATLVSKSYVMDANHVYRTDMPSAGVFYTGLLLNTLNIGLGGGGNNFTMKGSPAVTGEGLVPGIRLMTGSGSDFVDVLGADAPLNVDLGSGAGGQSAYQSISFGSASSSLDAIHDSVYVAGEGYVDVFVSNQASTQAQITTIDSLVKKTIIGDIPYQNIKRTKSNGDELNSIDIQFLDRGRINYFAGQGGDTIFVYGTPKRSEMILNGGPGQDVFWIETDTASVLGPVYVNGNAATGDYAYYYDYFKDSPQTYTLRATPSNPRRAPNTLDQQVVERRIGAAPVTYKGIMELVMYGAQVGGNQVYVTGVPKAEFLNMVAADNDQVTLGNIRPLSGGQPGINGDMSKILGNVDIGYGKNISVTLDDSGDPTGRNIVLHPKVDAYGDYFTGMSPGDIYLRPGAGSSVALLAGNGNDLFSMAGTTFDASMRIDGGGGFNTLDYSMVADPSSVSFDLSSGTASGLAGGFKRIQQVTGVP